MLLSERVHALDEAVRQGPKPCRGRNRLRQLLVTEPDQLARCLQGGLWEGKTPDGRMGDAEAMLELLWLVLMTVLAWARPRHELVAENLLLRHQLAVLTRPTRAR